MYNIILKFIKLWKMFNFTKEGDLEISYAGSKVRFCKSGDVVINAKRHTIHKRQLFFDGCDDEFIKRATRERARSKEHLERYVLGNTRVAEFSCETPRKRRVKQNDGN